MATSSSAPGARDRTRVALLEAAAAVFAEYGPERRLSDVAEHAGVGEATLYRHFSNRHSLLAALYDYSIEEAFRAIESADLPNTSVGEGIARIARAFVGLHAKYAVLVRMSEQFRDDEVERRLSEPIVDVLRRGIESGIVTTEFTEMELTYMLGGLIRAAWEVSATGQLPLERAASLASTTFLTGIAPQPA